MKRIPIVLPLAIPMFAAAASGQFTKAPTIAVAVDSEISTIEKLVVDAAAAMPEERFDWSPEEWNLPGADYQGVRTFAVEVKHIAASNYALWSPLTGDRFPKDFLGGDGPESVKTKAEIIRFVKDSFTLGHKAAATLTTQNMLRTVGNGKSSRLHRALFAVEHAFDHYGQMVEYLRMNGIVPPASRDSQTDSELPPGQIVFL